MRTSPDPLAARDWGAFARTPVGPAPDRTRPVGENIACTVWQSIGGLRPWFSPCSQARRPRPIRDRGGQQRYGCGAVEPAVPDRPSRRRLARKPAAQCRRRDAGLHGAPAARCGRPRRCLFRRRLLVAAVELPARPGHLGAHAGAPALGPRSRLGATRRPQGVLCATPSMAASSRLAGWLLSLPLTVYQGYFREHAYGMATQTFGPWFGEQLIGLAVERRADCAQRRRALCRDPPQRRALVAVGHVYGGGADDAVAAGRAGLDRPAVQHLQAGRERRGAGRRAGDGAGQRRAGRERLRIRRVAPDDPRQRQRDQASSARRRCA